MPHTHFGQSSNLDIEQVLSPLQLKKTDTFLDIGCANGYISFAAAKMCRKVYALDVHGESIEKVRQAVLDKAISNVRPLLADAAKTIPLDSKSVDVILLSDVLHGFKENNEIAPAFREIARVLRDNGIFSVVEFKKMFSPSGPPVSIRLSPEEVEGIAKDYGFVKLRVADIGPHNYEIVLRKKEDTSPKIDYGELKRKLGPDIRVIR